MYTEFVSRCITFLLFAALGYALSRKLPAPRHPLVWAACLAATLVVGYIGTGTRLVEIQVFGLYLNNSLQGLGVGLLSGWFVDRYTHGTQRVRGS